MKHSIPPPHLYRERRFLNQNVMIQKKYWNITYIEEILNGNFKRQKN